MRIRIMLLLLLLLRAPTAVAGPPPALWDQLSSQERIERLEAYAALDGQHKRWAKAARLRILQLRETDRVAHDQSLGELLGLLPSYETDKARVALTRHLERWVEARREALALALDTKIFPNPGPTPISGPTTGYNRVMRACKKAETLFNPVFDACQRAADALGKADRLRKRLAELDRLADRVVERDAWLKTHGRVPKIPPPLEAELGLFRALIPLRDGKYAEALEARATLPVRDQRLFFVFYGLAVLRYNARPGLKITASELDAVYRIGRLRLTLGILPLELDDRLSLACSRHLADMARVGYFGHFSPYRQTRTPMIRARRAKWPGVVGENIAGGNPAQAVTMWTWDGGHFRGMIHPRWTHIGLSFEPRCASGCVGGATGMLSGSGVEPAIPRPRFFPIPPPRSTQ